MYWCIHLVVQRTGVSKHCVHVSCNEYLIRRSQLQLDALASNQKPTFAFSHPFSWYRIGVYDYVWHSVTGSQISLFCLWRGKSSLLLPLDGLRTSCYFILKLGAHRLSGVDSSICSPLRMLQILCKAEVRQIGLRKLLLRGPWVSYDYISVDLFWYIQHIWRLGGWAICYKIA